MAKRILFWSVLAMVMLALTTAYAGNKLAPIPEKYRLITGFEPYPDMNYEPAMPGLITDSPGEVVGTTQYDYQSNGSSGNRAAVDLLGGVHFVWMNGISYPSQRAVYFNYVDNSGNWLSPTALSQVNGAGYCQATITNDNRAAATYHSSNTPSIENYVVYAEDQFTGFGIFQYYDPPDMLFYRCYWPYVCIDRNDNIHIVHCENAPNAGDAQAIGYTESTDGGNTWTAVIEVDTLETISQNVTASPVSDKVAIIYSHPQTFDTQWENDIYYIESTDGVTWDWRFGKNNITNYSDSVFAYTDLSAIYDYNDNLHIIWNTNTFSGDTALYWRNNLMHYSTGSGTISLINYSPENWPQAGCDFGAWNRPISKMSMGAQQAGGYVFVAYTAFFDSADCSTGGFANGEIYMQYSADGGSTWSQAFNLTNSPTPNCIPGDCDSDHWSALADRVDDDLHIIFIEDKDAGGIPQTEGQITTNPVKYLKVPVDSVTSVYHTPSMPTTFALSQNFPNPFNAQTNIDFDLDKDSQVELAVYSITGAKVTMLVDDRLQAGHHSVNWDAAEVASGVYYYRMRSNGEEFTRKMTLLK